MKILIIRFSSIGDIVLTSPVIRCLKKQYKDSEIHYLTKASYASLVNSNPYIDQVHVMQNSDVASVIKDLSKIKFDYVIDLHHNLRSFLVKKKLSAKSSSFYKANLEKWAIVNLKINHLPNKHIVDRYMDTLRKLNVANDRCGLDYFIPREDSIELSQISKDLNPRFIAMVIGAKFNTKRIPTDIIISICKNLQEDIVLIGGKEDYEYGESIRNSRDRIYNVCGMFTFNESADLLRQSLLVISGDTGMMHIAAALEKNIISIWGNTIPEFGMYPYYPEDSKARFELVQNLNLSCRPCSKIGYSKCPKDHFRCMNDLDVNEIVKLVEKLKDNL